VSAQVAYGGLASLKKGVQFDRATLQVQRTRGECLKVHPFTASPAVNNGCQSRLHALVPAVLAVPKIIRTATPRLPAARPRSGPSRPRTPTRSARNGRVGFRAPRCPSRRISCILAFSISFFTFKLQRRYLRKLTLYMALKVVTLFV
jgi:hypothetical protein